MKYSVLVVDDDDDDFVLLNLFLEPYQARIALTHVVNGIEATIKLLGGLKPHLLIVDTFMPLMDGYELLVWVKSSLAYQHIPVMIWAGDIAPSEKTRYYRAGAHSIVLKKEALEEAEAFQHHCLSLIHPS